ncbi:MAG: DMT family transporter [Planctomycetes bacterium]|nr:DMT family transporter [Planctomycetota bacterium]
MSESARARWSLVAAAALFSTGGVAIKHCSLGGWQVAGFRSGIAAVALALFLPAARRSLTPRAWLTGCAYAATLLLFALSNKLTTSANAIFLQSTAPLYLMILSPWLLGERLHRRDLFVMAAVAVGFALFFLEDAAVQRSAPHPRLGNLLAAASGLAWALTVVALRWLARSEPAAGRDPALGSVVAGNLIAFAIALPFALPLGPSRATDWAVLAFLGIVQVGLAYVLVTRGLRHVPAFTGTLLLLVEPALNPLWAWLALDEQPGRLALCGGALILGATALKSWWESRAAAT